jgi:hypothetical protein
MLCRLKLKTCYRLYFARIGENVCFRGVQKRGAFVNRFPAKNAARGRPRILAETQPEMAAKPCRRAERHPQNRQCRSADSQKECETALPSADAAGILTLCQQSGKNTHQNNRL